jgi:heme oxygenase (mycobilin-producing)
MNPPVVLINVFSVPRGKEDEFVAWWKEVSEGMKKQPGFLDARLHRSLKPDDRFQFINVAHWASPEAHRKARETVSTPPVKLRLAELGVEMTPALYTVEVEY